MKVCVDTNILVRAVVAPVGDGSEEAAQARCASALLQEAETIFVSLPVLCELTWVLRSVYRYSHKQIGGAIRALVGAGNVEVDRRAALVGLDLLEAGGDFADGVIAAAGFLAKADMFVSFDRRAVRLLTERGYRAEVPGSDDTLGR